MTYHKKEFQLKKCSEDDLGDILDIQESAFSIIDDSDILRRNTPEMLKSCLSEPHYTIGAFYNEKLVAFAILFDGEKTTENIGYDIGVVEDEICTVANIKLIIVHPDFRGNGLQQSLVSYLEKVAHQKNKKMLCATVSPKNIHSKNNFEKMGYIFHSTKTKYGGLERNIYYKIISN